jgi:DNA replication licensing factor MCM2
MRIAESFCKMRLSEFCTSQDIDRAIAVTVDSFVGSQKVSCKKALARAFAKYVTNSTNCLRNPPTDKPEQVHAEETGRTT